MIKKILARLNLGSKAGNPGYSFPAPLYNYEECRYERVGALWVGKAGGDTPEAREAFEAWRDRGTITFTTRKEYEKRKLELKPSFIGYNQSGFKYYDVKTGEEL